MRSVYEYPRKDLSTPNTQIWSTRSNMKSSPQLKALKAATTDRLAAAQQITRRFTIGLPHRDRSLKLPRSSKAIQVVINDPHNSLKTHVFKVYPCRHVHYQQAINGRFFYDTFIRINKKMGYFHLLEDALGPKALTMLASGR